ncbi:MAG: HD domain-containing protein [Paracoccus sp. (in: a-proteobacteria)]|uniref:HD domain-containing protein n=1 Tax=Paracoccus sp. TaxID=267 RepID=UPI004059A68A
MKLAGDDILQEVTEEFARKKNSFPRGGALDYPAVIAGWIKQLEGFVLPYITSGANAADGNGHLTMHDQEHVAKVRQIASNLIGGSGTINLTHFELTLLLVAIYLHDIGNSLGRSGHERQINRALTAAGAKLPIDQIEYMTAKQIAGVHGGSINGSKDTISTLPEKAAVYGEHVRLRLVAAILRLADELADDPARANKLQLEAGALPPASVVYHVVAAGLHSQIADVATREITLSFTFYDPARFKQKLGKGEGEVYLLDEIFDRSMKTFNEARYCSRFMRPYLEFERVKVDIMILDEQLEPLHNIVYTIEEHGYGNQQSCIYDLVPELCSYKGNGKLTPAYLEQLIAAAQKGLA